MDKDLEKTLKRRASGELSIDVKGLLKTRLATSSPPAAESGEYSTVREPDITVKHPSINPPPNPDRRESTVFISPRDHLNWNDWEEETGT